MSKRAWCGDQNHNLRRLIVCPGIIIIIIIIIIDFKPKSAEPNTLSLKATKIASIWSLGLAKARINLIFQTKLDYTKSKVLKILRVTTKENKMEWRFVVAWRVVRHFRTYD